MKEVLSENITNGKTTSEILSLDTVRSKQNGGNGFNNSSKPEHDLKNKNNALTALGLMFIIFAVYFCAGKLGLQLAYENASATAVWAPTGIALAFFLLRGYNIFPSILIGAFLINVTTTGDVSTSILIAIGNTLEGLLGAYLINKFANGKHVFESANDILKLVLLVCIAAMVSATTGVTSLAVWGFAEWSNYFSIWLTWWLGDVVGAFLITPLLIQWILKPRISLNKKKIFEAVCAIIILAFICVIQFTPWSFTATNNYPFSYLIIPPFVWIAFRFSQRFITTMAFLVCAVAIWGTLEGYGPFVVDSRNDSLLFLQAFIGIITMMSISFSSVVSEKSKNQKIISQSQKELKDFVENASVGLHWVGPDGKIIWANKHELDSLGYKENEYIGHHISEFHHSQEKINDILTRLGNNDTIRSYEAQLKCKDGSIKHVLISSNVYFEDGKFIHTRCFTKDITEKKKLELEIQEGEKALREAERQRWATFRHLLDKLPAGAYTCDEKGLITYYNEKAVEVWGREPKLNDPLDRYCGSFKLFIGDEAVQHESCWMAKALLTQEEYNGKEVIVEQPNGNRITVLAHANPIYDDSNNLIGAVNVLVDINERKKIENYLNIQYSVSKALAESGTFKEASQKVLQSICEGLHWELGALWLIDNKSDVLRLENYWCKSDHKEKYMSMVNPATVFEKGKGLPGRVWENNEPAWVPDVTLDKNFPRAPFAVKSDLHAGLAFPIGNKNEVIAVIECFDKKILEPKEDLLNVLSACGQQIGNYLARKLSERKLNEEYFFRKTIENSIASGIAAISSEGVQTYVNPALCNMLGWTEEELTGTKPPFVYWPKEEVDNISNAFSKTLMGTAPKKGFELRFCKKNGEKFDALVIVNQIKDNSGLSSGWLASVTDISKMKRTEKELKDSYVEMENKVNERTKELNIIVEEKEREIFERKNTEEKLTRTNKKLKETQEELIHSEKLASLGRFASGIAHEIRNPLANISALTQILNKDKSLDARSKQHLEYILENADIANHIIKDLLMIASPHSVNLQPTDVSEVIHNLYNLVESRCDKHNVKIKTNISDNLLKVRTNREKLHTAFLNLVSNSIEAMPQGGNLEISAYEDKQANEVVISFEDTGVGIKEENLDKVLEPFFTTKDTGTGLGLNLAYEVIKANSGKLNIKSKINEGTEIVIRLPVCKDSN